MVTETVVMRVKLVGGRDFDRSVTLIGSSVDQLNKQLKGVQTEGKKVISVTKDMRMKFQMAWLSVMFFGMLLQRTMQRLRDSTIEAFMKITEAQTEAGVAVNRLAVHWEWLKFTVGNAIATALKPLLPTLINIIEIIGRFIEKNQGLVGGFLIFMMIAAPIIMVIGQLALAYFGFAMLLAMKTTPALIGAKGAALGLKGGLLAGMSPLLTVIGWFIAFFLVLAYGRKALAGFAAFFVSMFYYIADNVLKALEVLEKLVRGFINLLIEGYNFVAGLIGAEPIAKWEGPTFFGQMQDALAIAYTDAMKGIYEWGQGPELLDMIMGKGEKPPAEGTKGEGGEFTTGGGNTYITQNISGVDFSDPDQVREMADKLATGTDDATKEYTYIPLG